MEQADAVAVWVAEIGLAPEPIAIGRVFVEFEPERFEAGHLAVEVVTLEVDDDVVRSGSFVGDIDREGRISVRTFKPRVSR